MPSPATRPPLRPRCRRCPRCREGGAADTAGARACGRHASGGATATLTAPRVVGVSLVSTLRFSPATRLTSCARSKRRSISTASCIRMSRRRKVPAYSSRMRMRCPVRQLLDCRVCGAGCIDATRPPRRPVAGGAATPRCPAAGPPTRRFAVRPCPAPDPPTGGQADGRAAPASATAWRVRGGGEGARPHLGGASHSRPAWGRRPQPGARRRMRGGAATSEAAHRRPAACRLHGRGRRAPPIDPPGCTPCTATPTPRHMQARRGQPTTSSGVPVRRSFVCLRCGCAGCCRGSSDPPRAHRYHGRC